MIRDNGDDN